jgi:hypothetical protein
MLLRSVFLAGLIACCQLMAIGQDSLQLAPATVHSALTAKKYKIVFNSDITLMAYSLDSLCGNKLYITGKNGKQEVSTDLIKKLQIARKHKHTFTGMAIGAGIGAVTGAIIGYAAYREPEPDPWNLNKALDPGQGIYAIAGGMAGMGIGLLPGAILGASSQWQHYDFTAIPFSERAMLIGRILSGQPHL